MKIDSNTATTLISFVSLAISAVTLYFYSSDRNKLKYAISSEYKKQLLQWHSETVEVLIELKSCSPYDKKAHLAKLSAQIEKGRFYFPNIDKDDGFGAEKPVAYQGYRNLTLDFLVYSYNLFKKEDCATYAKHAEILQREFTSNVFEVVRPKENLEEIKKLTDGFYASNKIFEDFMKHEASAAIFNQHKR